MAYYDEVNTEHCPKCNVKLVGSGAGGKINDDYRCSFCDVPLKIVRIDVGSFNEAPYVVNAIEIDSNRVRGWESF